MAMSRERKIYAAVLLVVGAGLAADRAFFGVSGARPVHAADIPVAEQTERSTPAAVSVQTLAARLKQVGDVPQTVDLLETTLQRQPVATEVEVQPETERAQPEDRRSQFAATHTLSALASNGRGANALINGRAVSIGEEIGGYVLTEVTREGAILTGPGGTVELKLPSAR